MSRELETLGTCLEKKKHPRQVSRQVSSHRNIAASREIETETLEACLGTRRKNEWEKGIALPAKSSEMEILLTSSEVFFEKQRDWRRISGIFSRDGKSGVSSHGMSQKEEYLG